ncbi:MAG: PQQ-binding-like beta-propeller repeat protein [Acidimicrobiales bacterium]
MTRARPTRRLIVVLVVVAVLAGCAGSNRTRPADLGSPVAAPPGPVPSVWPAGMADNRHQATSAASGPRTGTLRWRRQLEGAVVPGPVIAGDGSILAASNAGVLHALDPLTGADRWTYDGGGSYGDDLSTSALVVADGTILWPGPHSMLFAVSASGAALWQEQFDGLVLSPAPGVNGRVYVADRAGSLTAIEVGAGGAHRRVWTLDVGSPTYGSPAIAGDGTVLTTGGNDLVAVTDAGDQGAIRWRFATGALIEVSPAVTRRDVVVVGSNDGNEYGVDLSGDQRWRFHIGDFPYSSSTVAGDDVRFGDNDGHLYRLDANTGERRSEARSQPSGGSPDGVWTAAAVDVAGNAYFGTTAGHLLGADPDGSILFDLSTAGMVASYPAIGATGDVYIGSGDGYLYALAGNGA